MRRLAACERGTAAIEFAFIGLLLFGVTIGTVEAGRALFLMNELAHAADRAARAMMLEFDISKDDLEDVVRDAALLTGLDPTVVVVDPDPWSSGDTFRNLELSYPFTPMIAGFTIDAVTLTATRRVAK